MCITKWKKSTYWIWVWLPTVWLQLYIELLLLLLLSCFSHVRLCATPYSAAHQVPLPIGLCRQEHWSGLPFPSPYTPRVNPNSRHRLWVMIMCQCRFFNCSKYCSKCTTLVYDVYSREGCVHICMCVQVCMFVQAWRQGIPRNSVLSLFCYEPNTALKSLLLKEEGG